jgi:LmbE family N-acetylglucosaminyl deacetylase
MIARRQPDLVYLPSRIDYHPEHRQVAQVMAGAWGENPSREGGPELRIYPVQVPLIPPLANLAVDVSSVIDEIASVLQLHGSQIDNMPRALRQRRYTARFLGLGTHAEEFCRLSVAEYRRLHAAPLDEDARAFRGLRRLPFSDPLAYTAGTARRRRLAGLLSPARGASPPGTRRT